MYPESLKYSSDHIWVEEEDEGVIKVGVTDALKATIGEITYVELPKVGDSVVEGEAFGTIEGTKSVSELISPVSGTVVEVNEEVLEAPEKIDEDIYGEGWLIKVEIEDPMQIEALMDAEEYSGVAEEVKRGLEGESEDE